MPLRVVIAGLFQPHSGAIATQLGETNLADTLRDCYPDCTFECEACDDAARVIGLVEASAQGETGVIVLSDAIYETGPHSTLHPVSWVKEHVASSPCAVSLAVHPRANRILDIDRVVSPTCSPAELCEALQAVTAKLLYLSPPSARSEREPCSCRSIRWDSEWDSYLRLRHEVYSIMGYLEPEVAACSSKMELDSCDASGLHFGAFAPSDSGERLVGTARIVTNRPPSEPLFQRLRQLTRSDPVLRWKLDRELPLQLPVFQSQPAANPVLTDILTRDQVCGELSRVIVAASHRGSGIATRLVDHAIERGRQEGIERLFLECLAVHVPLYERMGFRVVPEMVGQVVGVQRTMGVMEYDFAARPRKPR